jgi:hypothetical protein
MDLLAGHGSSYSSDEDQPRTTTATPVTKKPAKVMNMSKTTTPLKVPVNPSKRQEVWSKNFQKIREFYEENGHLTLSTTYSPEYARLSKWLTFQRYRSTSTLRKDQLELLNGINYKTTPKHRKGNDTQWEVRYNQLKQAHDETGGNKVKIKEAASSCLLVLDSEELVEDGQARTVTRREVEDARNRSHMPSQESS